jgi:hypothetical protein
MFSCFVGRHRARPRLDSFPSAGQRKLSGGALGCLLERVEKRPLAPFLTCKLP